MPERCRKDGRDIFSDLTTSMAERATAQEQNWLTDFLLAWISRLSIFLSHHVSRPILFFYDLGVGIGSLTLGALLDLTNQQFSIMYAATAVVALLGLWIYWLED
jgi:hypothetical protein